MGASSSPSFAVGAGDSSRRAAKPSLEVLPIYVQSPTSQAAAPSSTMPDEVRRDRFGAVGSEDSLLSHAELAVEAVSSILHDSDLRRWTPYPLRRLWLFFFFKEPLMYVQAPSLILFFIVSVLLTDLLFLVLW